MVSTLVRYIKLMGDLKFPAANVAGPSAEEEEEMENIKERLESFSIAICKFKVPCTVYTQTQVQCSL